MLRNLYRALRVLIPAVLAFALVAAPLCASQCHACLAATESVPHSHCAEMTDASSSAQWDAHEQHSCATEATLALPRVETTDAAHSRDTVAFAAHVFTATIPLSFTVSSSASQDLLHANSSPPASAAAVLRL
jgi:hypothetical protein